MFEKVAHLLLVGAVELVSARLILSYRSTDNILPHNCLVLMSSSEKTLLAEAKHVEPVRAVHSQHLVLVVNPIEQFLEVQELLVKPEGTCWGTAVAKDLHLSETVSDGNIDEHSA